MRNIVMIAFFALAIALVGCSKPAPKVLYGADAAACVAGTGEICAPQWWIDDLADYRAAQDDLNGTSNTDLSKKIHERSITLNGLSGILNGAIPKSPQGVAYSFNNKDPKHQVFVAPPVQISAPPSAAPAKK